MYQNRMFKNLFSQTLIDLRELEGDYRFFNLQTDKAQSILSMIIASISIFGLLVVDMLVFKDQPEIFRWMVIYRGGFILFTFMVIFVTMKVDKVLVFDRLILGWLLVTVLFLLMTNFTRPSNYLTTTFDIILIFSIYVLSPLKFQTNTLIAFGVSVTTLFFDYFMKPVFDLSTL